jgi:hypothetical protein
VTVHPRTSSRPEKFVATVTLVHTGAGEALLNLAPLASSSLALEIRDSADNPVLLPPPPMLSGEKRRVAIGPGGSHHVEFPGFVPAWTPPGRYLVRFRYVYRSDRPAQNEWTGETISDWVDFEIVPGP